MRVVTEMDRTAQVVCLAGRTEDRLRTLSDSFASEHRVRVLPFSDQMPLLLAAANLLVHTTGGVTCLEAAAVGTPVIAFGAPPGHAPNLARKMSSLGLVRAARTKSDLRDALSELGKSKERPSLPDAAEDAATLILALTARDVAQRRGQRGRGRRRPVVLADRAALPVER